MVSCNHSRAKLYSELKMKYKKWSDAEGNIIKKQQKKEIEDYEARFASKPLSVSIEEDFQAQAVDALKSRMKAQSRGDAHINIHCARTVFYSMVSPQLENKRIWSRHFGDWAKPNFQTRVIGRLSTLNALRRVFGDLFVKAQTQPGLGGYQSRASEKGDVCGYLLFLDPQAGFKFSVCYYIVFIIC